MIHEGNRKGKLYVLMVSKIFTYFMIWINLLGVLICNRFIFSVKTRMRFYGFLIRQFLQNKPSDSRVDIRHFNALCIAIFLFTYNHDKNAKEILHADSWCGVWVLVILFLLFARWVLCSCQHVDRHPRQG